MRLSHRRARLTLLLLLWGIVLGMLLAPRARAICTPIEVTWYSPTGVAGCEVYGEGTASWWQGPGVARNDCTWPWTACAPISVTSHQTGLTIIVTPTMFCDCYTGTSRERIVDLDPAALAALGLDPGQGLYPVTVYPASWGGLPDTAMR